MNILELKDLIPSSKANIDRLDYLTNEADSPRIAVFGTYNHGKSTLLNALIGTETFKAADKRETIEIKQHESNGVIWVDTPGLDADVAQKDDQIAKESAFRAADFIFLVHNVQAGELDKQEYSLYNQLMRQDKNYKKKLFLVLTQIDQLDSAHLEKVKDEIIKQMPSLEINSVSARRYLQGMREGKQKLVELSGIPQMLAFVEKLKIDVKKYRNKEIKRLVAKTRVELDTIKAISKKELGNYEHRKTIKTNQFLADFNETRSLIKNKMETI